MCCGVVSWGQVLVLCLLDAIYYVPCFLVLLQSPATPILVSAPPLQIG